MKEGFAIYYALAKWEYLLRDRKFTILTDHKNLTRLTAEHGTNKMVKRWFMCFQEYDILNWEYVKGPDNIVPDSFSRLCSNDLVDNLDKETGSYNSHITHEHSCSLIYQLEGYEFPSECWDLIKSVHNPIVGHHGVDRQLG